MTLTDNACTFYCVKCIKYLQDNHGQWGHDMRATVREGTEIVSTRFGIARCLSRIPLQANFDIGIGWALAGHWLSIGCTLAGLRLDIG